MGADTTKIRVLFVNTATLPPLGADTWIHAQIMAGLDRSTHELTAACATGPADAPTPTYRAIRELPDLRIIPVNFGPELSHRSLAGKVRALVETVPAVIGVARLALFIRRYHVRILHTSDRPRDAFVCVLLARLTGAICIVHVHVAYASDWMGRMLKWSMRKADELVAVSEFVAGSLVAAGHDSTRTHVVLNAIDLERWQPGVNREAGRHEFGFSDESVVLITVCRLFREKGPAELIQALARVREVCSDVHLLVVGAELTVGFGAELVALVAQLELNDHVVFTGHRGDVPTLMAASDIYAMPSFEEPFGLVFVEAMAMQLPVVGLRNGGTLEVVEHGETGLLSASGDADGLADNLLTLISDPSRRLAMGRAGRRRVETHFTTSRMASDTASLYRLLTSRPTDNRGVGAGGPTGSRRARAKTMKANTKHINTMEGGRL